MTGWILAAFVLGFAYASAPGAVNTEALRRGLKHGFLPSFLVQVGALVGDLLWAVVGLTGVALFFHIVTIQVILGVAGVAFLLRMAWMSFLDARKPINMPESSVKTERNFLTGLVFSLANPFGIAFWSGVGGGFALRIQNIPLIDKLVILFMGFAVGAFTWSVGVSALVAWARRFVGERLLRGVFTLSSAAMAYFALEMLWELIHATLYPLWSPHPRGADT